MVYSLFSCHKCTRWSHPILIFSNISWNWICYQRASSAIYKKYFWKMTSLVGIVWKTNEILHIVQRVALGVCFSIVRDFLDIIFSKENSIPNVVLVCLYRVFNTWLDSISALHFWMKQSFKLCLNNAKKCLWLSNCGCCLKA